MSDQFTAEEIQETIRVARIYCDGFNQDLFQSLLDMKRLLQEEGYLEANAGLARLAKEGVPPSQALKEYEERRQRSLALEGQINNSEIKLQNLIQKTQQAETGLKQIKEATRQAQQELAQIIALRDKEKQELEQFRQEADREKENIKAEVDKCRNEAQVTQEEIETTAKIKAEVAAHGFNLDLILSLAKEFRGREKIREELAAVLDKRQTIKESNVSLEKHFMEWQQAAQIELNKSQAVIASRQSDIKGLDAKRNNLEMVIFKLQEDKAYEDNLRSFYARYWRVAGLMDLLATWDEVHFLRCTNPFSVFNGFFDSKAKNARFWMDKPAQKCPHCGLAMVTYDETAYQTLGRRLGDYSKIILGE